MMITKPVQLILVSLVVMATRSGCGNSGKQEPRAHHPSEKEWRSLTDTGQTLILTMGDQRFRLLEPHFEGDVFVAIPGPVDIYASSPRSSSTDTATYDTTDVPVLVIPAKQVLLYPSVVVSIRNNELRMTREELTSIQVYMPQKQPKPPSAASIILMVIVLAALKLLPLLL